MDRLHLAASAIALSVLSLGFAHQSFAQTNSGENAVRGILGLFGTIAQEAAKSNARKKWDQTSPDIKQCVNTMFATKNVNVDQIIAAGISPTDQRIAPVVTLCQTVMTAKLRTDFACDVTNTKGQQVQTTCTQSFAKAVNGSLVPVTRDDFLRAAANGEKVEVGNFETTAAQNTRLAEERRLAEVERRAREAQAEAERQRFLASPEGKRQVAAEAARARQAAAARQKEEADRRAAALQRDREFPYYAVFTCGIGYGHIAIAPCFSGDVGTSLEIRNGSEYGNYNIVRIMNGNVPHAKDTGEGYIVNLRNKFSIRAQNAGESNIQLGLNIYRRGNSQPIFTKEVSNYGVISASR